MGTEVANWEKEQLFQGLSSEELAVIRKAIVERHFEQNAFIIREGETGDVLYLILKGQVEILKNDPFENKDYKINILRENEVFGEMSLFNNNIRSASVRALSPTTVIELPIGQLKQHSPAILAKIISNFSSHFSQRLSETNQATVFSLKKMLVQTKKLNALSRLVIQVIILLVLYQFTITVFLHFVSLRQIQSTTLIGLPILFVISLLSLLAIRKEGDPLWLHGLTTKNWKKSVVESILFTIPIMALVVFLRWILIKTVPMYSDSHLFRLGFAGTTSSFFSWFHAKHLIAPNIAIVFYILSTPLQEFIMRGVLQSILHRTLSGHHRILMSILGSNLIFAACHQPVSWLFPLTVFIPGLFWGWLFVRQRTLIGVSLSHMILGVWALFIVGLSP